MELFKEIGWTIAAGIIIYINLIVLTDQIIAGKL